MKTIYTPTPANHIQSFCKVFLFACLLAFAQPASAVIRYVKTGATGNGTSWSNASGNLKATIDASQPGDEVWVAAGDYRTPDNNSFVMKNGVKIYGGFAGTETNVTQRNFSVYISRLLPFDDEAIIHNNRNGLTNTALLDGFTISNATQTAVLNLSVSPAFANCIFTNNHTTGDGGGMYNNNASPVVTNCSFTNNSAGGQGGAICNLSFSKPVITNCTFNNNAARYGGGILCRDAQITLTNCTFTLNTAEFGGGFYILSAPATLTDCTFQNNSATATAAEGGGVLLFGCNATCTRCIFTSNTSASEGGGIHCELSSPLFTNCNIKGNSGQSGGGIRIESGAPQFINCLISGNKADTYGGGVDNEQGNTFFTNCTISGNKALIGGAMTNTRSGGYLTIRNTVIYNNSSGIDNWSNAALNTSYSLVQGLTATTNGNISGATNPLFVSPVSPGLSAGGDYRLQPCSPLINKGSNGYYAIGQTPDISAIITDLDGNARFNNLGIVDMGAYERAAPTITATGGVIYVKAGAAGTGASWDCATGDLQAAINAATSGTEIWVAAGTYIPIRRANATGTFTPGDRNNAFVLKNDVEIYGGFAGTETGRGLRKIPLTTNTSILSGDLNGNDNGFTNNDENAYHVVVTAGNYATAVLEGFTIKGGNCNGSTNITVNSRSIGANGGGGIHCNNSSPTLESITITGNAGRYGAGLYMGSAYPRLTNSSITGNAGFYGGGILGSNCGATITNVLITGNTAVEQGGGMYNEWGLAPVLTNVTIAGNTANYNSGAMYNDLSVPIRIRNSIVYGNNSGINNHSGTPDIQYSLVQGETSTANGNIPGNVNPAFVNQPPAGLNTGGDYTLQTCSPAINAGNSTLYNMGQTPNLYNIMGDIQYKPRKQGNTVDLGPYEYSGSNNGNPGASDYLAINGDGSLSVVNGSTPFFATNTGCRLIANLQPTGSTNALAGSVNANVWIESIQPADYVKRHYQINPASNAQNATGRATLYFTQEEFDACNAVNTEKLPTSPTDILGKSILAIRQYNGTSNNGTGLPNTYSAAPITINPADNAIVWNSTYSRWEISFDFTGYGGFFVAADMNVLPLTLLSFNGRTHNGYNQLQWETADETNTKHFILERSTDGNSYTAVATIPAAGNGSNAYNYKDNISFSGKMYYRLKMVDMDEKFTYSTGVILNSNGAGTVSIYPNPATDKVFVSTGSELLQHNARLYDIGGRLLQTILITSNPQTIPVQQLKSGLYLLQFDNGTTVKFVKQ